VLTPQDAASILLHPNGGLKGIPESARVVMAITKVSPENTAAAERLAEILGRYPRVHRSLTQGAAT
jgi:hypothetical protein